MSRTISRIIAAGVAVVALAGANQAIPNWGGGLDIWNQPEVNADLANYTQENQELDARIDSVRRRIAAKRQTVEEMFSGRLSLRDAAVTFRALNAEVAQFVPLMRIQYPGASADECHCRNVIECARNAISGSKDEHGLIGKLEKELAQLRREGGGAVKLPT